jgi:hypothetical protein
MLSAALMGLIGVVTVICIAILIIHFDKSDRTKHQ